MSKRVYDYMKEFLEKRRRLRQKKAKRRERESQANPPEPKQ